MLLWAGLGGKFLPWIGDIVTSWICCDSCCWAAAAAAAASWRRRKYLRSNGGSSEVGKLGKMNIAYRFGGPRFLGWYS